MSTLHEDIERLAAYAGKLDRGDDLASISKEFAPTEYLKSNQIRSVLAQIVARARRYDTDLHAMAFADAPPSFQTAFRVLVEKVGNIVSEVVGSIQPKKGAQQPPRVPEQEFSRRVETLNEFESKIFNHLETLRPERANIALLSELAVKAREQMAEAEKWEKRSPTQKRGFRHQRRMPTHSLPGT